MRFQLVIPLAFTFTLQAQVQKKSATEASRQMSISYGSPSWNTNPARIDTAFLIIKDKETGKLVQVQLEEVEPDSSNFIGHFSLSLSESVMPEIYIPDQDQRGEKDYRKTLESIQKGTLARKPVIWKKNAKGQAMLDVYDTKEQASQAMKAYQEEQEARKKALIKPIPSKQTLEAAQQAERKAALEKLALEAAKRETDRVRMEQIEKAKAEERERQAKMRSEAEKAERREKAAKLNQEGMALFSRADFQGAEVKFREAVELDPENLTYQFKYGVSLYRNQKFNEALVALKIAKVPRANENERRYFKGLCHYRLNEFDAAVTELNEVAGSQDPVMAPSARFYIGIIQFAQEKYEDSKKSFETVIDTSQDSAMDSQAEEYLDRISAAMMFKRMRENKWMVMGVVGLTWDSNVTLAPDSVTDQGAASNVSDARLLTMGQVDYRPVLSEHHEWNASLMGSLTNSSKAEAAAADPWLVNLSAPYTYKGALFSKGYRGTFKPAYELLYMEDGGDTKVNLLRSVLLTADNTFIMTKDWFSTYSLEYRIDDSLSVSSLGNDNADAGRYSLKTVQTIFTDKARKEAVSGNLGYVINAAKGKNRKFNRIEFGATYTRPTSWGASWNASLNCHQVKFPNEDNNRQDFNTTLTVGLSKPVKEWFTWGLTGAYTKNNSNVNSYAYSKYTVMTTAAFNTMF